MHKPVVFNLVDVTSALDYPLGSFHMLQPLPWGWLEGLIQSEMALRHRKCYLNSED